MTRARKKLFQMATTWKEEDGDQARCEGGQHHRPEDPELAGPVDPRRVEQIVRNHGLHVDTGQIYPERIDDRGQQHRPVRIRQVSRAHHQEQRQHQGRLGDQDSTQDEREEEGTAAEGELGERIAGSGGQKRGDDTADHRVPDAVEEPAQIDAVLVRERQPQVGQDPVRPGEPQAETGVQVPESLLAAR